MAAMLGVGLIIAVFLVIGLFVPSRPGNDKNAPAPAPANALSAKP